MKKTTAAQLIERELQAVPFSAHPPSTFSYTSGLIHMADMSRAITGAQAAEFERLLHIAETEHWNKRLGRMAA